MLVKTPEVAQALIAAGASLEAKDKVSDFVAMSCWALARPPI